MAQLDHVKEIIGYLKLWLGIVAAVDVSITAWLFNHGPEVSRFLLVCGVLSVVVLTVIGFVLERWIRRWISRLEGF